MKYFLDFSMIKKTHPENARLLYLTPVGSQKL